MARIAFLTALLIAAIFFYFRDNTLWIFFALWFVWALLQQQIAASPVAD